MDAPSRAPPNYQVFSCCKRLNCYPPLLVFIFPKNGKTRGKRWKGEEFKRESGKMQKVQKQQQANKITSRASLHKISASPHFDCWVLPSAMLQRVIARLLAHMYKPGSPAGPSSDKPSSLPTRAAGSPPMQRTPCREHVCFKSTAARKTCLLVSRAECWHQ